MITIHPSDDPQAAFDACVNEFAESGKLSDAYAVDYEFAQYYLPGSPSLKLIAILVLERADEGIRIGLSITPKSDSLIRGLNCLRAEWAALEQWCEQSQLPWLVLDGPLALQPVTIPKPWGQEIWYTGIEVRGQAQVTDARGRSLPLPWLLSLCPQRLLGKDSAQIILLKILDPLPQPVFGDLYFEMHQEKREVYVVTHVDETAWPSGRGGIRFGFNQAKRAASSDDNAFKRDYLAAVTAYRAVRQHIDDYLDACRSDNGIPLDAAIDPETAQRWLNALPSELHDKEATLREAMETFVHVDPLQVGDVVKVPCYTPHSLLHGVRTVEFQTPVYERKILSFAQKVLTQSHWDTESALGQVSLESPEREELALIVDDGRVRIEEVAVFEDFRVERLTLKAGRNCELDNAGSYSLLMAVDGQTQVNGATLEPEQAMLVSAATNRLSLSTGEADQNAIVLRAKPRRRNG